MRKKILISVLCSIIKSKKIKTFFKNYLNFSNLKNAVKNKKVIKIITSNSLNVNYKEESLNNKKSKTVPNKNINEKTVVKNILERDNNIFNSKNILKMLI